jgi:hypothetical protein
VRNKTIALAASANLSCGNGVQFESILRAVDRSNGFTQPRPEAIILPFRGTALHLDRRFR